MSNSRRATLPQLNGFNSTVANPSLPVALEDGSFISARVVRLIELIRERWTNLEVKWIPAEFRAPNDPMFLIVEQKDGAELPVFFIKDEKEFDGQVIERLILSDNANGDVHNIIEARNEAVRLLQKKIEDDAKEERIDMIKHAVKSGKYDYTIPGREGKSIKLDMHGAKILRGEVQ